MSDKAIQKLEKGDILFRENDDPDAMYIIRKGRIAVTKAKGSRDITLAELGPGTMLGEMAFFDNRPRSAGAKALERTEVIKLPFASLHSQFKTFPEWLKSMVKTVNSHLRDANQRIKNLESVRKEGDETLPPDLIVKLTAIISLIGFKSGKQTDEGLVIPTGQLRNYTIQVFHQPTHKMNKLIHVFCEQKLMKQNDLGEGRIKTILLDHDKITRFTDWYNKWLFEKEDERPVITEKEVDVVDTLLFYGQSLDKTEDGFVTVNLTEMQNNSMRDLNKNFSSSDIDSLEEKQLVEEKNLINNGVLTCRFNYNHFFETLDFWKLIYELKKVRNS